MVFCSVRGSACWEVAPQRLLSVKVIHVKRAAQMWSSMFTCKQHAPHLNSTVAADSQLDISAACSGL
jgi:hypothetical protein